MKKTAIALAIAAVAAAPLAAQADAGAYGSIRVSISNKDAGDGADALWSVDDEASRFGLKGSEDLGNGLKAVGRYEFGVDASTAQIRTTAAQRLSYAGIEGDFGGVYLGSQWSPFWLFVGSSIDTFNGVGPYLSNSTVRLADTLAYTGNFGGTTVAVAGVMNNEDDDMFQAIQVGAKIPAGPVTIGVAHHAKSEVAGVAGTDGAVTGVAVTWNGGNVTVAGDVQISSDASRSVANGTDDEVDVAVYASFDLGGGNVLAGRFESQDNGGDATPTALSLGYQKNLSKSARLWAEFASVDIDDGSDADTELNFGIRKDW